ncbi:TrbM/KikA/MpfK family conjugal transfer protein [Pseudomonas sp. RP23018S]|uniref:TrbM/KikA/MpfK family conjugal transfer protein n=1 Tax=Pseudomonas sp. RP23018S TaxID=3096037 RepID=UPI002ACABC50|nr:TrbM/KikA/MpfK family conjugal transfer protein [Pseudomonas sp. RP23018S]MDZ5605214.1 TrbM/KikA/MpfK family conjugal transfer protein [Pseudomonas sp. RP23018S]
MIIKFCAPLALVFLVLGAVPVQAENSDSSSPFVAAKPKDLTKDQSDSCETVLCLAGGKDLAECEKPLKRFYDMKKKYRQNYLEICPKD